MAIECGTLAAGCPLSLSWSFVPCCLWVPFEAHGGWCWYLYLVWFLRLVMSTFSVLPCGTPIRGYWYRTLVWQAWLLSLQLISKGWSPTASVWCHLILVSFGKQAGPCPSNFSEPSPGPSYANLSAMGNKGMPFSIFQLTMPSCHFKLLIWVAS